MADPLSRITRRYEVVHRVVQDQAGYMSALIVLHTGAVFFGPVRSSVERARQEGEQLLKCLREGEVVDSTKKPPLVITSVGRPKL